LADELQEKSTRPAGNALADAPDTVSIVHMGTPAGIDVGIDVVGIRPYGGEECKMLIIKDI